MNEKMIEVKLSDKTTLTFDFNGDDEKKPITIGLIRIKSGKTPMKTEVLAKLTGNETQAIAANILAAKNKLLKACSLQQKRKELRESGLTI